jgi:hypothetical protein
VALDIFPVPQSSDLAERAARAAKGGGDIDVLDAKGDITKTSEAVVRVASRTFKCIDESVMSLHHTANVLEALCQRIVRDIDTTATAEEKNVFDSLVHVVTGCGFDKPGLVSDLVKKGGFINALREKWRKLNPVIDAKGSTRHGTVVEYAHNASMRNLLSCCKLIVRVLSRAQHPGSSEFVANQESFNSERREVFDFLDRFGRCYHF